MHYSIEHNAYYYIKNLLLYVKWKISHIHMRYESQGSILLIVTYILLMFILPMCVHIPSLTCTVCGN